MRLEHLWETAHTQCKLTREAPVVAGISGGADSLCLLDVLVRMGFQVIAAHFDHRLRDVSAQDAEVVRRAAARVGAKFVLGNGGVKEFAKEAHLSIEDAARQMRYRFLFEQARQMGAQAVAVGHTADDQVETFLLHMLRGAGLSGLKGMAFRSVLPEWDPIIPLVRPLLDRWRSDTTGWCDEHGLQPVTDDSNMDTRFLRNRVRLELLPILETYNPGIRKTLWRTTQVLAGEESLAKAAVETAWEQCLVEQRELYVALSRKHLEGMDVALLRGVIRRAAAAIKPDENGEYGLYELDYAAVERGVHYVYSGGSGTVELVNGLRMFWEADRLVLAGSGPLSVPDNWPQLLSNAALSAAVPGTTRLENGWHLYCEQLDREVNDPAGSRTANSMEAWFDADLAADPLVLRRPLPGDRIQPLGMEGRSIKLSDLFVNEKLPRRARAAWPVLASTATVIWVPGFRIAHPYRVTENTRRLLHFVMDRQV